MGGCGTFHLLRRTIQNNLKLRVATGLFQGETCRIIPLLVPSLRRKPLCFKSMDILGDEPTFSSPDGTKRFLCRNDNRAHGFPCTGHQGEERGEDGKELACFHDTARAWLCCPFA